MTYFPLAETHDTGTAYFESLGLIGGSTGMAPIISATTTMPSPDAYASNLTIAVTDSVLKYTQASASNKQFSFNLGASYSKLLIVSYFHTGTSTDFQAIGASTETWSGSQATQNYGFKFYLGGVYGTQARVYKNETDGGAWSTLASDTTIYPEVDGASSPVYGCAMYFEEDVQKQFFKFGSTSQWLRVFSLTDDTSASFGSTDFQTILLGTGHDTGDVGRQIAPFYVWGA